MSQCSRWPSCACGYSNGRKRQWDECGRKVRRARKQVEHKGHTNKGPFVSQKQKDRF